jgi:hypothetical protein
MDYTIKKFAGSFLIKSLIDNKITIILHGAVNSEPLLSIIKEVISKNIPLEVEEEILCVIEKIKTYISMDDIFSAFCVSINDLSIILHNTITTQRYYKNKKLFFMPECYREEYNNTIIRLTINNELYAVELNRSHPNADKHNYLCIDHIKFKPISVDIINKIIEKIEIINLDDCYYTPNFI